MSAGGAVLAIVNPAAGGGRCGMLCDEALERLRASGLEVESIETKAPGDASRIAADAYQDGRRDFVAVGGDGTGFEIINGLPPDALSGGGDRVSLGFLPLGTGNSFLRDFTDRGADHTLSVLANGSRRGCDVIKFEHDDGVLHFINILSYGFVADVAKLANRRFKRFGQAGYALGVVSEVATLHPRPVRLRLDGGRWWEQNATFVSINNSRFTGGKMEMAPYADTADGFVDLVVVGEMGRLQLLSAFPKIFKGTHVHLPSVTVTRAKRIDFDGDVPVDLMIDGEIRTHVPRRIDVLPLAIDVRV